MDNSPRMKKMNLKPTGFILLILLIGNAVFSQSQRTPAEAAYKHVYYLKSEHYNPKKSAEVLYGSDAENGALLADQLKRVMDAYGLVVDTNKISNDADYIDTLTNKQIVYPFADQKDIYLQKIGNQWYYSTHTVSKIPEMYRKVFPKGSETIAHHLRKLGKGSFMGIETWQWWGLLFLVAAVILLFYITYYPVKIISNSLTRRRLVQSEESARIIRSFARILSVLIAIHLMRGLYPMLLLPISLNSTILLVTGIARVVFLGVLLYRITEIFSLVAAKLAANTVSTLDDQLVPLVKKLVLALIIIGTFLLALGEMGVNLTALIAGLSIGGLALAFAAQDSVKNIFGSLMLLLDRSFQIGDIIMVPSIDNIEGTVEDVGLRSTSIRTFDNSLITVPNGKLAEAAINNLGMRVMRRYRFNIGITYDTPPAVIESFVYGIRELMQAHPLILNETAQVHFYAFENSSLAIRCACYFDTLEFPEELNARHNLMIDIVRLADLLGVRFAFPTSTLHIEEMPGHQSLTPKFSTPEPEMINAINAFIARVHAERNAPKLHDGDNAD